MINEKYQNQVKVILEKRLRRAALPDELANALTDTNIAAELLLSLHEENVEKIEKAQADVDKLKK